MNALRKSDSQSPGQTVRRPAGRLEGAPIPDSRNQAFLSACDKAQKCLRQRIGEKSPPPGVRAFLEQYWVPVLVNADLQWGSPLSYETAALAVDRLILAALPPAGAAVSLATAKARYGLLDTISAGLKTTIDNEALLAEVMASVQRLIAAPTPGGQPQKAGAADLRAALLKELPDVAEIACGEFDAAQPDALQAPDDALVSSCRQALDLHRRKLAGHAGGPDTARTPRQDEIAALVRRLSVLLAKEETAQAVGFF
jgi:hypothetical protein